MRKLKSIVIIDDDEISNFLFVEILQRINVTEQYKFINHPKEGLEYLKNAFLKKGENNLPPDLIFLDYRMPVMDAKEFIQALHKENLQYAHWYNIVLISSGLNHRDKEHFFNLGVKGILEKPITAEQVLNVVNRINPVNHVNLI